MKMHIGYDWPADRVRELKLIGAAVWPPDNLPWQLCPGVIVEYEGRTLTVGAEIDRTTFQQMVRAAKVRQDWLEAPEGSLFYLIT